MSLATFRAVTARPFFLHTICVGGALVVTIGAAPLRAQAPQGEPPQPVDRQHVVRRGDTLWDLAQTYLADPFLWPEIHRLNTSVVEDPHWVYPGEALILPGQRSTAAAERELARVPDSPDSVPVTPPPAPRSFAVAAPMMPRSSVFGATRVARPPRARVTGVVTGRSSRAIREGEVHAAPWLGPEGGPPERGRIVASAELPGIVEASRRTRLQAQELVYITLPSAMAPEPGARYLVISLGPEVEGGAQLVVPTGVLEVEHVTEGAATTARIVQQFDEVLVGQGVIPLQRVSLSSEAQLTPVESGQTTEVVWLPSGPVLPSLQHYVVVSASSADGVRVGDQFTLFRPPTRVERDVLLPAAPIALVRIVRVTDHGSTGVIVDQEQPSIAVGTAARHTARMP